MVAISLPGQLDVIVFQNFNYRNVALCLLAPDTSH
jgi:hypothetical protein